MNAAEAAAPGTPCPRCGAALSATIVRTVIWWEDHPAIVEDIPAQVCGGCAEQYYEPAVSEALLRLADARFPAREVVATISVPVFSLKGRIRADAPPDDCFID